MTPMKYSPATVRAATKKGEMQAAIPGRLLALAADEQVVGGQDASEFKTPPA